MTFTFAIVIVYIVVTVASGVFLKVCTSVLEDLRGRFSRHNGIAEYEMIYDYVVG